MPDERARTFWARSHKRVLDHCDALLAWPLTDDQRSRVVTLRKIAEAELQSWMSNISGPPRGAGNANRVMEFA